MTEIFYDTPEDAVNRARSSGQEALRLYGTGWGYAKPGWQQGRFEDYRILARSASVDMYNFKDGSLTGTLDVTAASADRPKPVSINGTEKVFSAGRLSTQKIPLTLQPGHNAVSFISPSDSPLFVLDIRWTSP